MYGRLWEGVVVAFINPTCWGSIQVPGPVLYFTPRTGLWRALLYFTPRTGLDRSLLQ